MNEQFKAQITYKAREFATAYTNQLFPNEPAFSFGHEGWAKFVDAMVELTATKTLDPAKWVIDPRDMEQGYILNPEWLSLHGLTAKEASIVDAKLLPAAPVLPAPVARDGVHSDQVALLLSKVRVAACVIENLPELPGYNGSVLTIDDTEAARISKEFYEIAEFFDKPQAAPVAQLSEPPEADMFWNNDDPERCADSIHEVLEREWQDGILQVGDIRTIQQAMKMPNVRVRVTSAKNDEDGFDYDFIEPAAKPQQTMFDDLPRPENCGTGHCSCIECPFAAAPTTPKE